MNSSLYTADYTRALPEVLRNDDTMLALAQVIRDELHTLVDEMQQTVIYPDIDRLPEDVLDILAYDFKVDWWDFDLSLAEKRRVLKDSWRVHRRLGTKYAVETSLHSVFPGTRIEEWFTYGGEPFMFRVVIDASETDHPGWKESILRIVGLNKNLRSHLEPLRILFRDVQIANETVHRIRNIHRALLPHEGEAQLLRVVVRIPFNPFDGAPMGRYNGLYRYDGTLTWTGHRNVRAYPFPARDVHRLLHHNAVAVRIPAPRSTARLFNGHRLDPATKNTAALQNEISGAARLATVGSIRYNGKYRYDGTARYDGKTAQYAL